MAELKDAVNQYVNHLYALQRSFQDPKAGRAAAEARAALAQLRRAVGKEPGTAVESLPLVMPYLRDEAGPWEREAFFLVGGLFGLHPIPHEQPENLGHALRRVGDHESAEKRFAALLGCRRDRLDDLLRQAVRLAKSHEVPINYRRLLFDLLSWDAADRRVQLQWARAYWRPTKPNGDAQPSPETEESEE